MSEVSLNATAGSESELSPVGKARFKLESFFVKKRKKKKSSILSAWILILDFILHRNISIGLKNQVLVGLYRKTTGKLSIKANQTLPSLRNFLTAFLLITMKRWYQTLLWIRTNLHTISGYTERFFNEKLQCTRLTSRVGLVGWLDGWFKENDSATIWW